MTDLLSSKYRVRGERGSGTVEWTDEDGRSHVKPATFVEWDLVRQNDSLISALSAAMRRNAQYEAARGGSKQA